MSDAEAEVCRLLSRRIGLDPTTVGPTLIAGAILTRMKAAGVTDPAAYVHLVQSSDSEFGELVELVVVSESWFFRDSKPFDCLAAVATRRWFLNPATPIVRALSIPCAGGEEPYSIAMTLLDAGFPADRIHIDAVDLSLRALDVAARAVYGRNSFREPNLTFRERYFRPVGSTFALDSAIKRLVQFHHLNLFDPMFFAEAQPYQAIFCRNLLIYLDTPARHCMFNVFDRLLADDGVLFIGHAEAAPNLDRRFLQLDGPGSFCYERRRTPPPPPPPPAVPWTGIVYPIVKPAVNPKDERRVPPVDTPARPVAVPPAAVPIPLLKQAAELANQRRHAEAIQLCERALRQMGPKPEVYHLLGMIHQSSGALDQAEGGLGKAVYLDPKDDEALLALALIADRRGRDAEAALFRRRADRARRAKEPK